VYGENHESMNPNTLGSRTRPIFVRRRIVSFSVGGDVHVLRNRDGQDGVFPVARAVAGLEFIGVDELEGGCSAGSELSKSVSVNRKKSGRMMKKTYSTAIPNGHPLIQTARALS
jgi:hypothetical protein